MAINTLTKFIFNQNSMIIIFVFNCYAILKEILKITMILEELEEYFFNFNFHQLF